MALKKMHTWVAVIGIAIVAAAAWWFQNKPKTVSAPSATATPGASAPATPAAGGGAAGGGGPAAVEVGRAEALRIEDDAVAVGTVRAAQTVMLRPEVSGRVVRIGFKDGQRVKRGQLLVQLDDLLQRAQLQQAEAQASIARTNLQRSRELLAQNFVSQSAVDQNGAALDVAMAQVALAKAQLARLTILAPFDGVAGIGTVDVGDYLKDGADIVSLEDRSHLWVDFRLPERYIGMTKPGLTVKFTLDALPGQSFDGKVEALDSLIDANGRSLLARARIDKPSPVLTSGMFARARILFAVRERAVVVPEEALVPLGGKQYLFKAVDGPATGAADLARPPTKVSQRLEAKLGVRQAGKVEILEGVAPGDLVVTAGHQRLVRGDALPLRIVDLAKAGEAAPKGAPGGAAKPAAGASAPRATAPT
ncbi:MAG TPA: efflux RND transporter periplasmic adaptor subunit [Burkholderiaceae bacterium]|nr:efflux RND transporter periplasmic adaptor subunit [Burkholderiaceae bacterium]